MSGVNRKKKYPKNIKELRPEELLDIIKKKKACDATALRIVEYMCEVVDTQIMLNNLFYINQCHYDDIVNERSVLKKCGYPLCLEVVMEVPKQQFKISLKSKTVYDITERKKFCSNKCFKASEYLKNQLFTSPLWFRDTEVKPTFKLLDITQSPRTSPSFKMNDRDNALFAKNICDPDMKNATRLSEDCCSSNSVNEMITPTDVNKDNSSKTPFTLKEHTASSSFMFAPSVPSEQSFIAPSTSDKLVTDNVASISSVLPSGEHGNTQQNENESNLKRTPNTADLKETVAASHKQQIEQNHIIDVVMKIEKCLEEWFTFSTYVLLLGEDRLRSEFRGKEDILRNLKLTSGKSLDTKKFDDISRLFSLLNLDGMNEVTTELKPLPDYAMLKAEAENLNIKVQAFYSGKLKVPATNQEAPEELELCDSLPLVDSYAQTALRRRVFLDRLNRTVPDMCVSLELAGLVDTGSVRSLVHTFSLSAHNITFQPREWYLISVIIIKMISLSNKTLSMNLRQEESKKRMTLLLMSYNLGSDYLDNLMEWLTDSERLTALLR